jgi:hypothetical protein
MPEVALAVRDHKFQNQCAVQNTATPLPESLSGLIERVTFFDELCGSQHNSSNVKRLKMWSDCCNGL